VVLDGPEKRILLGANQWMKTIPDPQDIIVTWNGAVFDLPFINDRARTHGMDLGIALTPNTTLVPKYQPVPGHAGGYDATWAGHHHIDLAYLCKDDAENRGVKWSLKPYVKDVLGI